MSQMTATKTDAKAEFQCSCGRTFAHEISLKRHCWVTGHTADVAEAAPPEVEAPVPALVAPVEVTLAAVDVVDEAIRILREKQMAQVAFEARQARERQVRAALECASTVVQQSVQKAAETTRQGAEVVRQSTLLALRMLLMILVCGGLLLAGMGVGRLLATPADASSAAPTAQRQLVGHQTSR
jgi:hypothetical protein